MKTQNPTVAALFSRCAQSTDPKQRDLKRAQKSLANDHAAMLAGLVASPAEASSMNQKAAMRTAQACDFATSTDVKACDPVTAALVALVVLSTQTRVSFADAHIIAGASKEGNAVSGVSRARLAKFLPRTTNLGAITSKVSRTVGRGSKGCGMFEALGITRKGDKHGFEITNRAHPLILAYAGALEKMTDDTFKLLTSDEASE